MPRLVLAAPQGFQLPRLPAERWGLAVREAPSADLDTTFHDTLDLRLTRWRADLRRTARGGWRLEPPSLGAASHRASAGAGERPRAALLDELRAFVRRAALRPALRVAARRRCVELVDDQGAVLAHLVHEALDPPHWAPGGSVVHALRVEFSERAGPALVEQLEAELRAAGAEDTSDAAPLARLLGEPVDVDPWRGPEAEAEDLAASVVRRALARSVVRLVQHDAGMRRGEDPEDVHQARVAARRLRSDLRTFEPLLDAAWAAQLRRELRWLARRLGSVRDADVLDERLRRRLGTLPAAETDAASALLGGLAVERSRARARLLGALRSDRHLDLLDTLDAAARAPRLRPRAYRPAFAELPGLVAGPWHALHEAVGRLGATPANDDLHQVRILAKRCRYAAEAVAPALPGLRRLARALARLQEVLGEHQDAVVTGTWLRQQATDRPQTGFAAGLLASREASSAAQARAGWKKTWKKVLGSASKLPFLKQEQRSMSEVDAAAPERVAVLGVSPGALSLTLVEGDAGGPLRSLLQERIRPRLGPVPRRTRASAPRAQRAAEAAALLCTLAARAGATRWLAYADSAVAQTEAERTLLDRVGTRVGVPVHCLDAARRAQLVLAGIAQRSSEPRQASEQTRETLALELEEDGLLLARGRGARDGRAEALALDLAPLATLRAALRHRPPTPREQARANRWLAQGLEPALRWVAGFDEAVASGPAACRVARCIAAQRWRRQPPTLQELRLPVEDLEALARTQVAQRPGPHEDAWILASAARALGLRTLVVSEWGLTEGLVLEPTESPAAHAPSPAERRRSALELVARAGGLDAHAGARAAHCVGMLFDATHALHGLGDGLRELVVQAARLEGLGHLEGSSRKRAARLVAAADPRGFGLEALALLAALVRSSGGGAWRDDRREVAVLSPPARRAARTLAGLLRVALGLERAAPGAVDGIVLAASDEGLRLRLQGEDAAALRAAARGAEDASDLLRETFERPLKIEAQLTEEKA